MESTTPFGVFWTWHLLVLTEQSLYDLFQATQIQIPLADFPLTFPCSALSYLFLPKQH